MNDTSSLKIGILLANTGTPDSPTPDAVREYLREFLSDQRVIRFPRWLWYPILHGIILNTRPKRSAKLYEKIWEPEGSPLLKITEQQAAAVSTALRESCKVPTLLTYGMRYGKPSIAERLRTLRDDGANHFVVLPLFPQYSGPTTGSIEDAVTKEIQNWASVPSLKIIPNYYKHPKYIQAVAQSIETTWDMQGKAKRLLFSYHGIPESYSKAGDPYYEHCLESTKLVADHLGLDQASWQMSFQSRLGPIRWLGPYSDQVLEQWGSEGLESVQVVCPGFAADCLETIYEIDMEGRALYERGGGKNFHYIRALNSTPEHIQALADILIAHIANLH